MKTAKVFMDRGSQAIRLPKEFRVRGSEVLLKRMTEGFLVLERAPGGDAPMNDQPEYPEWYYEILEETMGAEAAAWSRLPPEERLREIIGTTPISTRRTIGRIGRRNSDGTRVLARCRETPD